ncbi:hypothetical protein [Mariniluteicoccus flavus]
MTDDLDALADRADQLTRRLEGAAASRLRARTVADPRGVITFEMDDRNELAHVKVSPSWRNLSADQLSDACVEAYQALGDAILNDWAEALTADDGAATPPVRPAQGRGEFSLPPDEVLMASMERTARQFERLEQLEATRLRGDVPVEDEDPVVGRSRDQQVTATFSPDGMLTGVEVSGAWTSGSPVRLGEAIAEAIRDAVAQGERREAERERNPYAALSDEFARAQNQTRSMLRRSGLV